MDFYRTTNSSIHARIAGSLMAVLAQPGCLIPITSRDSRKTPLPSRYTSVVVGNLMSFTQNCLTAFSLICRRPPYLGGKQASLPFLSTQHFVLSTVFPLPQQFSLNCCCPTLRRSNYARLLRKISLFRLFAAVVKSPVMRCAARIFAEQLSLTAKTRHIYCIFCFYSVLCTQHSVLLLLPILWRDWRYYATKYPFLPQNRQTVLVWSPLSAILPAPPLPPQQKSSPIFRFAFVFTLHSELCTLHFFMLFFVKQMFSGG
jgi:hypothetical protein